MRTSLRRTIHSAPLLRLAPMHSHGRVIAASCLGYHARSHWDGVGAIDRNGENWMRWVRNVGAAWFVLFFCIGAAWSASNGIPDDQADLTQEITLRCMYDMGEFGEAGMQACVQSDLDAVAALRQYPPEAQEVIARCVQSQWTRGYAMVRQCVDRALQPVQ